MDDVKYCSKCGEEMPLDAIYCQKCGYKVKSENVLSNIGSKTPKNKSVIVVAVLITIIVAIVGGYYLMMPQYDFDTFNELIEKSNIEIEEGEKLELDYTIEVLENNEENKNIDWTSGDISSKEKNVTIFKDRVLKDKSMNSMLENAKSHYKNSENLFLEMKSLNLPNTYYEYINKNIDLVQKKQKELDLMIKLENNRNMFIQFLLYYTEGDIYRFKAGDEIKKTLDSYSSTEIISSLDNAIHYTNLSITKWKNANNIIYTNALRNDINSLECIKSSVSELSNSYKARLKGEFYYTQNTVYDCRNINGLSGILSELSNWTDKNIAPMENEITILSNEITTLKEETEKMWNNLSNS